MIQDVILGDIINTHRSHSGSVDGNGLIDIDLIAVTGVVMGDNVSKDLLIVNQVNRTGIHAKYLLTTAIFHISNQIFTINGDGHLIANALAHQL